MPNDLKVVKVTDPTITVKIGGLSGSVSMATLSDTSVSSVTAGDIMRYDGSNWVNEQICRSEAKVPDVAPAYKGQIWEDTVSGRFFIGYNTGSVTGWYEIQLGGFDGT